HLDSAAKAWRSEQAFIAGFAQQLPDTVLFLFGNIRIDVLFSKRLPRKRLRQSWKRLRFRRVFARHVGLWNIPFFNGPERSARGAIQYEKKSLLGWLRNNVHIAPVVPHGQQLRRGR